MKKLDLKGIWIPIKVLEDKKYVEVEIIYKQNSREIELRKLKPKWGDMYLTKVKYPRCEKGEDPIEEKFKDNKYNKKNKYIKYIKSGFKENRINI